jgi:hypothetical protein
MAHDVFLSYSSQDKPVADAVCAGLEAHKLRCWIAPRDVLPGQEWAQTIVEAIQDSRVVVIIFSAKANSSKQVLREVERGVNTSKIIVPFRIEDVVPSKSMEYYLSVPHWLDAMSGPMEQHIQRLAGVLERLLHPTAASAEKEEPSERAASAERARVPDAKDQPASQAAPATTPQAKANDAGTSSGGDKCPKCGKPIGSDPCCDACGWVNWSQIMTGIGLSGVLLVAAFVGGPMIESSLWRGIVMWGLGACGAIGGLVTLGQLLKALTNKGGRQK